MTAILENFIIKITSSLLYDIAKNLFLKEEGLKHYKNAVEDTILYFIKNDIELLEVYFDQILEDNEIIEANKSFYDGDDFVSDDLYVKSLLKTKFYYPPNREEKAKEIISYFINILNKRFLGDPKTSAIYINSVQKIQFSKITNFVTRLRNNLNILNTEITNIHNKVNTINDKQDIIIERQTQLATKSDIRDMMTDIVRGKVNTKGIKSKIEILIEKANEFFNKEYYDTAREKYFEILKSIVLTDEEKWRLNRNIAFTYLILNDIDNAIHYFNDAYKALPDDYRGKLMKIFVTLYKSTPKDALDEFEFEFTNKELDYDERSLKINILLKLERYEDAKNLFNEESLQDPNNRYIYSKILFDNKEYAEAISELEKIIKVKDSSEINYSLGISKLILITNEINQERYLSTRYPQKLIDNMIDTKRILNEAISKLERTDNRRMHANAIFNRGILNGYLGLENDCLIDFEYANRLGLDDIEIYFNLGVQYLRTDNIKSAAINFEKAYCLNKNKARKFYIDSLIYNKEYDKAKRIIFEHITYPDIVLNIDNIITYLSLAIIFEKELERNDADNILSDIEKSYPYNTDYILFKAKILLERNRVREAIIFLESKKNKVSDNKEVIMVKLADYYFVDCDWNKAKDLYINYLDIDESIRIKYVKCLYNLGKFEDVIKYSNKLSIENNIDDKDTISETLGYSYLAIENYKDALPIFKNLAMIYKNSNFYYNWSYCEIKLTNYKEALKIVQEAERIFQGKYKELVRVAISYSIIGEKKKAVDLAYTSAINLPNDEIVNGNFIQIIHSMINYPELVNKEQVELYNYLIHNWDKLFPMFKFVELIPIEEDLKTIRTKLEERSKEGMNLFSMYDRKKIPLTMFTKLSGVNIFDAWKDLKSSYMTKIYSYNPNTFNLFYENVINSQNVIIDPFAFFTLYELGFSKYLENHFFPQGLLDALVEYKAELDLSSKQGRKSLMNFKGKLIMLETSADEIMKEIETVENMINIVKNYVKSPNQTFIDKRMISSFEKSSVQAVNLSLELKIPIICDDSILNDLLTNEIHGYRYSNTFCYINKLLKNGKITELEFSDAILKLISMNYYFVPLTANNLLHNIENLQFSDSSLNKRAIESLKDINLVHDHTLIIVCDFIIKIYLFKILNSFIRDNWVEFIINEITKNDSNPNKTIKEIYNKIEIALKYLVKEKNFNKEIINEILKWLSQLISTRNKK